MKVKELTNGVDRGTARIEAFEWGKGTLDGVAGARQRDGVGRSSLVTVADKGPPLRVGHGFAQR